MPKTTPNNDDEIDLIELVKIFLTHKTKFIILGIVGLALGLVYAFQHEPRFETNFKVIVGHPIFSTNFLANSAGVQEILSTSELNKRIIPSYSFNRKTKLFKVITKTDDSLQQEVTYLFTEAVMQELDNLKNIVESFEEFNNNPIIHSYNNKNNNLTWTNQDIAKVDLEQVAQSVKVIFGDPKVLYPKPLKNGVIGIFMGLVLAFFWMMADILMRQLKKK